MTEPTDAEPSTNISIQYAYSEGYESGFRDGEMGQWRDGESGAQGEPSDAQVLLAYRAHLEARMGRPLDDVEFESTKSRLEMTWISVALRAVGVRPLNRNGG